MNLITTTEQNTAWNTDSEMIIMAGMTGTALMKVGLYVNMNCGDMTGCRLQR